MLFRIRYYIWTDIKYLFRTDVPNWLAKVHVKGFQVSKTLRNVRVGCLA